VTIISHCTLQSLSSAAKALREGHLVIFPTETVYGLGADAENESAVRCIYEVKGRPLDHPVIVHIGDLKYLDSWISDLPGYALDLARSFWPGSMTLVLPRSDRAQDFLTGGQESVGVRIPAHPLALQLLKEFHELGGRGVAAPSANRFGDVSPTTAGAAAEELGSRLHPSDLILDGGPCVVGIESTVIDCRGDLPVVLRPGAITAEMIGEATGLEILDTRNEIRVSGNLENHYAPKARVIVGPVKIEGAGFIALATVATPEGMNRLASPGTVEEYARDLYKALREADHQGLKEIVVVPPSGDGLALAIRDRIEKARTKDS
jgi:L-threonylcarbamoyladenylate synthase